MRKNSPRKTHGKIAHILQNANNIRWRRRRDLNPRAGYPTYTLSRGASSANLSTSPFNLHGAFAPISLFIIHRKREAVNLFSQKSGNTFALPKIFIFLYF